MTRAQTWSSRSLGSRLQHGFFYALIRLGGRRAAYALLFWVVLWYMFKPEAARRCGPYLGRRFPGSGPCERWLRRWRLQWELGKALVDRAVAGITGQCAVDVDENEIRTLRELHSEGRGLIMLGSHVGAWHISMSAFPASLTAPVGVVLHRDAGDVDRHYFEHSGEKTSFTIIDPADGPAAAVAMVQILQQGGVLCMMGDRPFGDARICRAPLLGGTAALPYTAYYLASVTGAPVVVFFSYRTGPGRARNVVDRVIRAPEGLGKRPEPYEPYAAEYAAALENSAAGHPYQFFNFYNMWEHHEHQGKTQEDAG